MPTSLAPITVLWVWKSICKCTRPLLTAAALSYMSRSTPGFPSRKESLPCRTLSRWGNGSPGRMGMNSPLFSSREKVHPSFSRFVATLVFKTSFPFSGIQVSGCIHGLSTSHSPVFLLNSCLDLFSAPALTRRDPLSRSYRVNLPSSLTVNHPSALVYSTRPRVSVYGTGTS